MSDKLFSIYRSSAGSGKTRTLAKEYLKLALRFKADYYKHILAVTFTNKATQEMKDRILAYLDAFANGNNDSLAIELMKELKIDAPTFKNNCQALQSEILHNYSQFSISTIDAFFQKVIRSFTREAGLSGDYRLEIDQQEVIEEVVDKLVDELGTNPQLTRWVIDFAKENLENDRPWDVRSSLIDFAREIFREEFRAIEDELMRSTDAPDYFKNLQHDLRKECFGFTGTIKKYAEEALAIIKTNGWTENDFKYSGGAYNFLVKMSEVNSVKELEDEKGIGKRPRKEYLEARHWPDKDTPHAPAISQTAGKSLIPLLKNIIDFRDAHYKKALSAEVVMINFYAFGLVADLSRKLREHKEENNIMLLADAPKFLNGIIQDSDTPFIYEKVGSFYRNYLIDEFQDTSGMQWGNFKPLLINSLDQGYTGMVVGDVKQSIYRWRGGDLKLLQQDVEQHIGSERVEVNELSTNFRSAVNVINFNNAFFEAASSAAEKETGAALVRDSYSDATQQLSKTEAGVVKVQFVKQPDNETSWKEEALLSIPKQLEQFQEHGISLRDVAVLVRNNREGVEVAEYLLQYKNEQPASQYRYDVISNESLRIDGAVTVNIIVSALRYMVNPEDLIARAQLSYDYRRLQNEENDLTVSFSVSDKEVFKKKMPIAFTKEQAQLKKLPLYELTETLIEIFELGKAAGELVYLQTFQNLVLDFSTRERNDIAAFLEWWEENKNKKSIQVSGEVDAVQIFTIHKSKGLQFKYVLIPFCSWEVDHAPQKSPMLWVKTSEAPFSNAYVPVKYSSILEDTVFNEAYQEEKVRAYLDNLNLLYVAFTRAELGLYVHAPHPEVSRAKGTVAKVLYNGVAQSTMLAENWNEAGSVWQKGELRRADLVGNETNRGLSLHRYEVNRWRKRMVLRKKAENIFRNQHEGGQENRKRGVLLHAVFSKIQYAHDCDAVFQQAVQDGLLSKEELPVVQAQFSELLKNELVRSWFDASWDVRTEVPILAPNKADVRVDRIMLKEDRAVVIDYKTGAPRPSDEEQVTAYIKILQEMNYVQVEGYLLYVNSGQTTKVELTRTNRKSEKNQNQLGLAL